MPARPICTFNIAPLGADAELPCGREASVLVWSWAGALDPFDADSRGIWSPLCQRHAEIATRYAYEDAARAVQPRQTIIRPLSWGAPHEHPGHPRSQVAHWWARPGAKFVASCTRCGWQSIPLTHAEADTITRTHATGCPDCSTEIRPA